MIRFIHTADIHFGMENYGRIDPTTGIHTRLLDFYQALQAAIDCALENSVDFFLFAGDAYKTAHPSPTQQRLLFDCFLRLFKAEIPIVIIVGNHDNPLSFGKAHALELFGQLPVSGFHVIAKPTLLTIKTKHGPLSLVGIPWPSRATVALKGHHTLSSAQELTQYISRATAALIEQYARELDPSIPAVLSGHLTVSSGIFSGSEKRAIYGTDPVLLPSQLALDPFDYVALGHLHRYQNLNPEGIPVVYSGSIERVDFGERKETKGFCLVTLRNKRDVSYEFIPTQSRPFLQIETQLEGSESQTDQLIAAIQAHPIDDAVVKIVYHVPPGKRDRVDINALQQYCARAHYLAGIVPVRIPESRERRISFGGDKGLHELLDAYIKTTKPELVAQREALLAKVTLLEQEIADDEGA